MRMVPGRPLSLRATSLTIAAAVAVYVLALALYTASVLQPPILAAGTRAEALARRYDSLLTRVSHLERSFSSALTFSGTESLSAQDRAAIAGLRERVEELARHSAGVRASRLFDEIPPTMRVSLAAVSTRESGLTGYLFEALRAMEENRPAAAREWLTRAEGQRLALWTALIRTQSEGLQDLAGKEMHVAAQSRKLGHAIAIWGILGVLLAAFSALLFHLRFYTPLSILNQGLAQVARGEYDVSLSVRRADEIGLLIEHFNEVAEVLRTRPEVEALRESEARLRALAARLEAVREEERRRLAVDLHDQIGQALTSIRMDAQALASDSLDEEEAAALLRRVVATVDENTLVVQNLCLRLRPPVLDFMGLGPAIEALLEERLAKEPMTWELDLGPGPLDLSDQARVAAYRIMQEALTNTLRHAGAGTFGVGLSQNDRTVEMRIWDDGVGFPDHAAEDTRSLGLVGIQERVAAMGGRVAFGSRTEGGALITLQIPRENPSAGSSASRSSGKPALRGLGS